MISNVNNKCGFFQLNIWMKILNFIQLYLQLFMYLNFDFDITRWTLQSVLKVCLSSNLILVQRRTTRDPNVCG